MTEGNSGRAQANGGTAGDDRRAELIRSFGNAAAIAAGVKADQLGGPTPCRAFDVQALVDHLVGAGWRVVALGRGESPSGESFPHVELEGAAGELEAAAAQAAIAWADDSRLTATTEMPWGEIYSGRVLVDMYLAELAAHTWDLAAATGQLPGLDADLPGPALQGARAVIRPEYRNVMGPGEPFAAEVEPPAGATDWERFAAFMGRPPGWQAPEDTA